MHLPPLHAAAALVAIAILCAATPSAPAAGSTASPRGTQLLTGPDRSACTETPFSTSFDAALRARWPGRRITAAVYDSRTGCQYAYRGGERVTTASVLKIEIMAAVLLRAQRAGRGLTATERSLIGPMIRTSDDPSANALWSSVGGTSAMTALDRELGLVQTRATSPWGLTSTSATDRNLLLRRLVLGEGGPFSATTRSVARSFLLDVTPSQRWGITAGVPASWKVPLKNGFFPASCCGWRVNTSGVVERPDGSAYVLTVLSDGWSSLDQGIPAVEQVARVVASWNLIRVGPHLSAARFARQVRRDVLGAGASYPAEQAITDRMGAEPSRAGGEAARLLADPRLDATSATLLRLYLGVLHRLPEAATWSGRVAQLRSGDRSTTQVADAIATSAEFTGGSAMSTASFVDRAYLQVYGRPPSAADRRWWADRIDRGAPRGSLLLGLVGSDTFRWSTGRTVQVAQAFLTLVRRLPTATELATWSDRMWAGSTSSDVAGFLISSNAYRSRFT